MKLIGCLLALAVLGCLAEAQLFKQPQQAQTHRYTPPQPQRPANPPQKYTPPQTQQPQQPQQPQQTQQPANVKQPQQPAEVFHSCDVNDQHKIQCGAPDISRQDCEAINCCFDGRTCFYGKMVTLQCTKDAQMIIVVARTATLPNLDLETISFQGNDPACSPVDTTSAFAIYQFPVTACGTIMMEEPGVIIYENRMSSAFEVAIGDRGVITRDTSYQLMVQCRYVGTSVEALVIEVGLVPPPPPVAAPGPIQVDLRLANGECMGKGCVHEDVVYNSFYMDSDYPVTKVLRDPVYVDVRVLHRTDPNVALTLGRCWATSDPYPFSLPQWDLLIDGCPYRDDRYQTRLMPVNPAPEILCPTHHKRFVFKMFTFVSVGASNPGKGGAKGDQYDEASYTPLKEQVYIHCETSICQLTPGNNCEPRCFRKRRSLQSIASAAMRREDTVVVSSPLIEFTTST